MFKPTFLKFIFRITFVIQLYISQIYCIPKNKFVECRVVFRKNKFIKIEMDTVQILCTLRDVKSFLDVFPSIYYHSQSRIPPPSSSMPIPTQKCVHNGYPCTSDPNLRVLTTFIHMTSYRSYRPSWRSLNATARRGTITGDKCKV